MISISKLDGSTLVELIKDLLNKRKGIQLVQFSAASKLSLVLQQGFGTSHGKRTIICDIKSSVLTENELLNKAANDSNSLFNEWNAEEYLIVIPQNLSTKLREDFESRISPRHRKKLEILDLNQIEEILFEYPEIDEQYFPKMAVWYEVYSHIADLLVEYYENHKNSESNVAKNIFEKLEGTKFAEYNSGRLFRKDSTVKEKGLDPIQIFASFSYTGIKPDKRLKIINSLLLEFNSNKTVTSLTSFDGCPYPIITKIIQFRGWQEQNEIWRVFDTVYNNGFNGLEEKHFNMLKKWHGLDIASFTMFLFWINPEDFLPLDKNTVGFLKTYNIIEERPRTYKQYIELCKDKVGLSILGEFSARDTLRFIVKDAYNFYDSSYEGEILSGSTASVITKTIGEETTHQELEKKAQKERKEQFKGFQIIALRPLIKENQLNKEDKQIHLKNLQEGTLYKFYDAYQFERNNDNQIKYDREKEVSIYNHIELDDQGNEKQLNVSISSIVGKNGSGKSTIADFLYLIINKIAFKKKIKSTEKLINEEVFADLFVKADKLYKISVGKNIKVFHYDFNEETDTYTISSNRARPKNSIRTFDIERFCYSVVVNYSLYGLNSKQVGKWIDPLFHKNDSYQVPIVLNPKRENGNINVNIEEGLAKSRLLSNILEPDLIDFDREDVPEMVSGSIPEKLTLALNYEKLKRKKVEYRKQYNSVRKRHINIVFDSLNIDQAQNVDFLDHIKEYIYFKVVTIADHYPKFQDYKSLPEWVSNSPEKLNEYLGLLNEETSHICFKLRQAVNFLKYGIYHLGKENILSLSKKIRDIKDGTDIKTIELIPPSFLKTNIVFKHGGGFSELSSGEKQQIFSINTIAYHVYNIESVMYHEDSYKYNSINILFDEVELYFHPEMQRTYIKRLLERLYSLKLNDINNINILFITHSPFILSDIPSSNILRVKVDPKSSNSIPIKNSEQTFGANIHDLLAQDFFLDQGFMGDWAKHQIQKSIALLNYSQLEQQLEKTIISIENSSEKEIEYLKLRQKEIEEKLKLIGLDEQILSLSAQDKKNYLKSIIKIIGEPVLQRKLQAMFNNVFIAKEDAEIEELRRLAKKLNFKLEKKQ